MDGPEAHVTMQRLADDRKTPEAAYVTLRYDGTEAYLEVPYGADNTRKALERLNDALTRALANGAIYGANG
jgi:hypothetical protein